MKKSWILSPVLFLVLLVGATSPAVALEKKAAPISQEGWCCQAGQIFASSLPQCSAKGGIFSATRVQAQKACHNVKPGFCLSADAITHVTAAQCRKIKGQFFPDRRKAEMARRNQNGWCLREDQIQPSLRGRCSGKDQQFYLDKNGAKKAWQAQQGWCREKNRVTGSNRGACLQSGGTFFSTQKAALQDVPTKGPAQGTPKASGMQATGPRPPEVPQNPVPLLDDSGGILIIMPQGGILRGGTAITVTYRFTDKISDQPVQFEIFSGSLNRVVAQTSHRIASGKTNEAQGGALAKLPPRERSFTWNLPWDLSRSSDCFIQAESGDLSGRSDPFEIEPAVDLGAVSEGIEVLSPRGGEILRPGGLITVRFRITHPPLVAKEGSQFDHFVIRLISRDFMNTYTPFVVENGDPNAPETDIVFRMPENLQDRVNDYTVKVASTNQNGHTIYGISKAFSITSATTFGDATSVSDSPGGILEVVAPNGGEFWGVDESHVHTARWRLRLTGGDRLPGEWRLIFMRHAPTTGFEVIHALTPAHVDVEEISWEDQTAFAFSTDLPDLSDKLHPGRYKLMVKGLDYEDLGDGFFTVDERGCSLAINGLSANSIFLLADVDSCDGVEQLTFRVEEVNRLPATRIYKTTDVTVTLPEAGEPVSLGAVENFVNDLGAYDCGILFQVTVDPEEKIDSGPGRPYRSSSYIYLGNGGMAGYYYENWGHVAIGNHGYTGGELDVDPGDVVHWDGAEDFVVCAKFKNCGHLAATGAVNIRQKGDWPAPGRLDFSPHDILLESEDVRLGPGQSDTICIGGNEGLVMAEGSTIEFDFTGDLARWAGRDTAVFYLNHR